MYLYYLFLLKEFITTEFFYLTAKLVNELGKEILGDIVKIIGINEW